jgi:hypothetical protein
MLCKLCAQGLELVYSEPQQHRFVHCNEQSVKRILMNLVRYHLLLILIPCSYWLHVESMSCDSVQQQHLADVMCLLLLLLLVCSHCGTAVMRSSSRKQALSLSRYVLPVCCIKLVFASLLRTFFMSYQYTCL